MIYIAQGAALGLSAAASPGPFQAYLVTETLSGGWRRAFPVAFAPLLSDIPIVIVILLLLNRLPAAFLQVVSLAGGLFLLYLVWGLWRSWLTANKTSATENDVEPPLATLDVPLWRNLGRGVLINALSPGPYLFWTLVNGPLLLDAWRQSPLQAIAFLASFYGVFIGGNLVLIVVFHQARRLGPRFVHLLALVSIFLLFIFALVLLARGVGVISVL